MLEMQSKNKDDSASAAVAAPVQHHEDPEPMIGKQNLAENASDIYLSGYDEDSYEDV